MEHMWKIICTINIKLLTSLLHNKGGSNITVFHTGPSRSWKAVHVSTRYVVLLFYSMQPLFNYMLALNQNHPQPNAAK